MNQLRKSILKIRIIRKFKIVYGLKLRIKRSYVKYLFSFRAAALALKNNPILFFFF